VPDLVENRSIKLRARYRYSLKQIGCLPLRFGGLFAQPSLAGEHTHCSSPHHVREPMPSTGKTGQPAFSGLPPDRTGRDMPKSMRMTELKHRWGRLEPERINSISQMIN
jgi:hypothetical protein